jgi:hypothetical protein
MIHEKMKYMYFIYCGVTHSHVTRAMSKVFQPKHE